MRQQRLEYDARGLQSVYTNRLGLRTLKPEEREFVVDSGASMHMVSKKDLSKA